MSIFQSFENKLVWQANHETLQIEPWGRDALRVRATMNAAIRDDLPGALLDPPAQSAQRVQIEIGEAQAVIRNGLIEARLSAEGRLGFFNTATGAELLEEETPHFARPPARHFKPAGGDLFWLEAKFKAYPDERLYGLGQHPNGRLDQKGCVIDLVQNNTEVCIPFALSSRGYGWLWHNPSIGRVELGHNRTRWVAEATRQLDYWIVAGSTPADILGSYADATGHTPNLPEFAAGFWQCKLRYKTQEELLSIAREYKRRGLPLSVIVIDFFHWTVQGDWKFDPQCWPDPAAMVRELAELGVRVMVSVWPSVNPLSENYSLMQQRGWLIRAEHGLPTHMPFWDNRPEGRTYITYYDATHPEARQFVWERVRENYLQHGVKVWWLDACEPEVRPLDMENLRYHLGPALEVGNLYPQLHQRGFFEGMQAEGETDIITLCRSAWAGSQRYAAAVWSGDIPSTFESLQAQVRAGLNIGLSGIPWWTTDIGGFMGGDTTTVYFRELIVRWFQYGVFCPLFRLHGVRLPEANGSGAPNEVWSFGEEAYAIIKDLLFLRERLRPYIMEQMRAASERGLPPMRPLFVDFPHDPTCYEVDDQLMFGPDVLVAPVLEQGARSRRVYLPQGLWRDAWTDEKLDGGQWMDVDAPLTKIPVFVRGERQLPFRG